MASCITSSHNRLLSGLGIHIRGVDRPFFLLTSQNVALKEVTADELDPSDKYIYLATPVITVKIYLLEVQIYLCPLCY